MEKKTAKKTQKAVTGKKEMEQPVDSILEVTEFDQYLFGMGTHYKIYEKLGAHLTERNAPVLYSGIPSQHLAPTLG